MKLPIYMKSGNKNTTIIVKWWGVLWLKLKESHKFFTNNSKSYMEGYSNLYYVCHYPLAYIKFMYLSIKEHNN